MPLNLAKWSLLALVVSLSLVRPFSFDVAGVGLPFTDLIFPVVFGCFAIAWMRGEIALRFDWLYLFIGLYAAAFTISAFASSSPRQSFIKLLGEFYLFALCLVTFNLARDQRFMRQLVYAWLTGTAITAVAWLAGFVLFYLGYKTLTDNFFLSHFGSLPAGNYPRIRALLENANMLANFLNVGFVLSLLAWKLDWIKPIYAKLLLAGTLFAALFSFSPGLGGIALSAGLWFFAVFTSGENSSRRAAEPQRNSLASVSLACGLLFAIAVFAMTLVTPDSENTQQQINIPFTEKPFEPSVRVLVWQNAFDNIVINPVFGKGTGLAATSLTYRTASGDYQILTDAHNIWLNVTAQIGVVGLLAFLLLMLHLVSRCRFHLTDGEPIEYIRIALSVAFVGSWLYQGLTGSFEDARHLWVLTGMLAASSLIGQETDVSPASISPLRRPST